MRRLTMPVELTVEELVGYASSWSAYSIYRKQYPSRPDPLVEYKGRLTAALEGQVGVWLCVGACGRVDASALCAGGGWIVLRAVW